MSSVTKIDRRALTLIDDGCERCSADTDALAAALRSYYAPLVDRDGSRTVVEPGDPDDAEREDAGAADDVMIAAGVVEIKDLGEPGEYGGRMTYEPGVSRTGWVLRGTISQAYSQAPLTVADVRRVLGSLASAVEANDATPDEIVVWPTGTPVTTIAEAYALRGQLDALGIEGDA